MADQSNEDEDLAIDYALDLTDPDQRLEFEWRLREDVKLQDEVRCLEEVAADLSLLAPQVSPDAGLCASIMERIGPGEGLDETIHSPQRSRLLSLGGWAVAACLAIAAVVLALSNQKYRDDLEALREVDAGTAEDGVGEMSAEERDVDPETRVGLEGAPNFHRIAPGRFADRTPRVPLGKKNFDYRLKQDLEALRDRVSELKKEREERYQAVPGLARLTVIEMLADPETPQDEVTDPELEEGGADDGSVAEMRPGSPDSGDSLIASNQSTTFDAVTLSDALTNGLVGLGYLDSAVFSSTFSASTGDSQVTPSAALESYPVENPEPAVVQPESLQPMSAYTIYDETTGEGSILVQNLPAAEDATRYQLWMVDSLEPEPVNVGGLPELENGGGQVFFELGEGGYSPAQFFITRESVDGSEVPTGEPVLSGPRATEPSGRETIEPAS